MRWRGRPEPRQCRDFKRHCGRRYQTPRSVSRRVSHRTPISYGVLAPGQIACQIALPDRPSLLKGRFRRLSRCLEAPLLEAPLRNRQPGTGKNAASNPSHCVKQHYQVLSSAHSGSRGRHPLCLARCHPAQRPHFSISAYRDASEIPRAAIIYGRNTDVSWQATTETVLKPLSGWQYRESLAWRRAAWITTSDWRLPAPASFVIRPPASRHHEPRWARNEARKMKPQLPVQASPARSDRKRRLAWAGFRDTNFCLRSNPP